MALGRKHHIGHAAQIVDEVRHAVAQWPALVQKWQVTPASDRAMGQALAKIDTQFKSG